MSDQINDNKSEPEATFLGWQKTRKGDVVALYNITVPGHPSYGSTVSAKSLVRMNLEVPIASPPPGPVKIF